MAHCLAMAMSGHELMAISEEGAMEGSEPLR